MISIESEERPWGRFFVLHDEPTYKLKRIEVDPGGRLSYQYHHKRSEAWTIVDGVGTITLDGNVKDYSKGETVLIPQGVKHRIENKGSEKVVFIEGQTGTYFGEDDIVRIEDDYNRVKMSKPKAIIVSGYFNPLHKGHLELFEKAKAAGDELWVIVNSDIQRTLKGSKVFMDENERQIIVSAIKYVDKALISKDNDKTQCATLAYLADEYGADFELYFDNGGDQNNESIPEVPICNEKGIGLLEGLGDKIQSSSWLLKK